MTVRDIIVTSRGNFSQNVAIQVLDSVDNQIVANSFKSHPVRVLADGVKPIKPEAKCDWARGGCAGPNPAPLISEIRVFEDGVKLIYPEAKED